MGDEHLINPMFGSKTCVACVGVNYCTWVNILTLSNDRRKRDQVHFYEL